MILGIFIEFGGRFGCQLQLITQLLLLASKYRFKGLFDDLLLELISIALWFTHPQDSVVPHELHLFFIEIILPLLIQFLIGFSLLVVLVVLSHDTEYQSLLLLFLDVQQGVEVCNGRIFFFIDHPQLLGVAHQETYPNDL